VSKKIVIGQKTRKGHQTFPPASFGLSQNLLEDTMNR